MTLSYSTLALALLAVVAAALRESAARLGGGDERAQNAPEILVHPMRAADFLADAARDGQRFDLAFVDPPFRAELWDTSLAALVPCLASRAFVYVESAPESAIAVPAGWQLHRELATRDARTALYRAGIG